MSEEAFQVGEGVVEITPPLGIEMAGFHKPPGKERRITGIRQPTFARALFMRLGRTQVVIVSVEVIGVSRAFAQRAQKLVARKTGVPSANIRICATHSHSTPALLFLRQWGAVSEKYRDIVAGKIVEAVELAKKDLAPADTYVGSERAVGGNFNRTAKTWKTDEKFNSESTDDERWLDTTLHALYFLREKPKRSLVWYHFSAHPVCYTDDKSGPDWPGIVFEKLKARDELEPAYLQGHAGDVNPGNGKPWLGDPEQVSEAVYYALHHAINHSTLVRFNDIRLTHSEVKVPLDTAQLKEQLDLYRKDPSKCIQGEWVDGGFAKDWFERAMKWSLKKGSLSTPMSALRLGEVALLFHSAELYSFYGLKIRLDSPFPATLAVGYTDDLIGYLPDPNAYKEREYAAIVVPKILDHPPFMPTAAREFTAAATALLKRLA
ncbi:MAG: neutral/alkaline non-lysosomal ceramidase N-terminal domain-containing protein [Verrucomicrobia bacterium]|nr:neutral/alkaline non-lysosomal ceramidase N-terminal domain-containing protein [Verrucomicrobiota bacterium]